METRLLLHLHDNTEVFWTLLSRVESLDTCMYSAILIFLKLISVHKNKEEGLTVSKLKKKLTLSPRQRHQNLIEFLPAH